MIKVVVTSNPRIARVTQGEPRTVCNLVEQQIRLLTANGHPYLYDVVGPADRAADVARVKGYLNDVVKELAIDAETIRLGIYAEAKTGGPQQL